MSFQRHKKEEHPSTTTATTSSCLSIKEAVKVLYPQSNSLASSTSSSYYSSSSYSNNNSLQIHSNSKQRFTQLLLEHGEYHLQDWAVVASSSPYSTTSTNNNNSTTTTTKRKTTTTSSSSTRKSKFIMDDGVIVVSPSTSMGSIEGRLRLCSRSVVFEPTDPSRGIVRCPFERMNASPFLSTSSETTSTMNSTANANSGAAAAARRMRQTSSRLYHHSDSSSLPPPPPQQQEQQEPSEQQQQQQQKMVAIVQCNRHYVMKTNNVIGPFTNVEQEVEFRFSFLHSEPIKFFELSQTLFHMVKSKHHTSSTSTTSPTTKNNNPASTLLTPPPTLSQILRPMLDRPFDPSNYVHPRERPLTSNLRCSLLTPLLTKAGCSIVTKEYIYFQPASGVFSSHASKAISWRLENVVAVARRYRGLKDCAIELFFGNNANTTNESTLLRKKKHGYGRSSKFSTTSSSSNTSSSSSSSSSTSVLLAFETTRERERVLHLLPKHIPCHTDRSFLRQAYTAWKNSIISNFDYLLILNSASGRTFHDLSRYPVFPWIISDYTSPKLDFKDVSIYRDLSKPVGALDEKRLEYFQMRYSSMAQDMEQQHAFLYGTHYSAPGYVLYYLIRNMPEHMLCLQNGKFDAPDRMFYSIKHTYASALRNHTDVKELIPEFYDPSAGFDFLINARSLQLGTTQTGDRVHDVKLPPWAKSPRDYIKKNRMALESDITTTMLPKWIDLVFGEKSRGESARENMNLFHPTAYFGPSDLEGMSTEEERMQAELQATEFGIVPDLLFCLTHPSKEEEDGGEEDDGNDDFIAPETGRAVIIEDMNDDESDHLHHHESKAVHSSTAVDQPWELLDAPTTKNNSNNTGSSSEDVLKIDHSWSSESMSSAKVINTGGTGGTTTTTTTGVEKKKALTLLGRKAKSSWTSTSTSNINTVKSDDGFDKVVRNGNDGGGVNGNYQNVSNEYKTNRLGSKNSKTTTATSSDEFGSEIDRYNRFSSRGDHHHQQQQPFASSSSSKKILSLRGSGDATRDHKHHQYVSSRSGDLKGGESSPSRTATLRGKIRSFTSSSSPSSSTPIKQEPLQEITSQGWELKQITSKTMHGDSVSGCSLLLREGIQNHSFLATVSLDGGLMIHTLPILQNGENDEYKRRTFSSSSSFKTTSAISRFPYIGRGSSSAASTSASSSSSSSSASARNKLNLLRTHSSADPLACLVLTSDDCGGHVVFAGGHDDVVLAYGINSGCALASVYSHRDAVTGIDLICRSSFGEERSSSSSYLLSSSSASEKKSTHIMVSGSWDATVKVWSVSMSAGETVAINREPLAELFDADSSIVSVSATKVNGVGVAICAGCDDGSLVIWMCRDDGKKEVIHKQIAKRGGGACSAVKWLSTGYGETKLFAGFATGKLVSYVLADGVIRPMSKIVLGSAVRCITATEGLLFAGCADGSLQLILVDYEGNLDAASRKWNSVNGSKSPSISCVSIAEDKEATDGKQYICATGCDDGSVVVSRIKEI